MGEQTPIQPGPRGGAPGVAPGSTGTARAPRSERATESAASRGPFQGELQALFSRAVRELASELGCEQVLAWGLGPEGRPLVLASRVATGEPRAPEPATFERLARLGGAEDLGSPAANTELQQIAAHYGISAAVPVAPSMESAAGILVLGGESEPAGRVRPRSLERLSRTAEEIGPAARAALSGQRLAQLDSEVQRLDRLSKLGELVAEIVHEIRNPLVSVKTFLQLLPERENDPEFSEGFLEVASDELRRVERLLEVVLEHARPAPGTRQDLRADVTRTFESVTRLIAHRAAEGLVTIRTETEPELPSVQLAPDSLRQLVLNLVMNALEVSPQQGEVRLRARGSGAQGPEDGVEIRVEDDGPGIPEALRDRLFEPFTTSRTSGAGGLGLAICQRIVQDAGGQIAVEEAASGGACFVLRLPAASADA
ncbi:MAG: ATP-binding protein [Myxococcota bacterium]|nr:ATP-binding protein [Myxococcota bacterium]